MLVEESLEPQKFETMLLKIVIPDIVLVFFFFSIILNAIVVLSQIVQFPAVLLLIPAVTLLSFIFSFLRFYSYITDILRVMGAYSHSYKEFGKGKASLKFSAPTPFLVFKNILNKHNKDNTKKDSYKFSMNFDSNKYKVDIETTVTKGVQETKITVIDWHNITHQKKMKSKVERFQKQIKNAITDIRMEVLESQGVSLQAIETPKKEKLLKLPERVETKQPVIPVQPSSEFEPAPLEISESKPSVAMPAPAIELPKAVEEVEAKRVEVEQALKQVPTEGKTEAEALQAVLFQLEEIEKLMKND